ncbi:helix-turn-helix domain-containing protein [Aquimarina mytili]|uniref:Helix-turn-helix transcriptional regulator n=1 Tax=Aquimarina mytili TaxID=874423 RepID=A0A937DA17_9FLAO|nr:AraC family transcriptional regulator [Aquimarina mytili]MBL0685570.1 helix-turn-helix transcriptional regulator [Aquimarina mytili]
MKKYVFIPLAILTISTTIYNYIFPSFRILHNQNTKSNSSKSNSKPTSKTPITLILSLAIACIVIGILTTINEPIYIFPVLIILSIATHWFIHYSPSRKYSQKSEKNIITSKKAGETTFTKIREYIITEEKYLSPDINLNSIAVFFNMSKGYISQLINVHAKKSFNDYINELRVEASQKMLLDQQYDNYTIESIGLECGFTSKSNFYTAFKKVVGQTPNQYKKLKK